MAIPEVAAKLQSGLGPVLKTVPVSKRTNVYVCPWHLDMSPGAKFGEQGKYPSMVQVRCHFPSIVWKGFMPERDALEIKFDLQPGADLGLFNVKYIDGHCKGIMVQAIFALIVYMESSLQRIIFYTFMFTTV